MGNERDAERGRYVASESIFRGPTKRPERTGLENREITVTGHSSELFRSNETQLEQLGIERDVNSMLIHRVGTLGEAREERRNFGSTYLRI
jgi:hypothetical protein